MIGPGLEGTGRLADDIWLLAHNDVTGQPYIAVLDEQGIPGYLEASDERTRALYLRYGYADRGSPIDFAGQAPPWFDLDRALACRLVLSRLGRPGGWRGTSG